MLTVCDVVSAYTLTKITHNKWAGLFLYAMPSTIWWTSHEGQFESLSLMFMLLTTRLALQNKWKLSGFTLALGIQTKIFGVLLVPALVYFLLKVKKEYRAKYIKNILLGVGIGFCLFSPFYIEKPLLLFSPLIDNTNRLFNPFWWNIFDKRYFELIPSWLVLWNFLLSAAILLSLMAVWFKKYRSEYLIFLPSISFWVIVKSLSWATFYYPIHFLGTLPLLSKYKKLFFALLVLAFLQDGRVVALILNMRHIEYEVPFYDKKNGKLHG